MFDAPEPTSKYYPCITKIRSSEFLVLINRPEISRENHRIESNPCRLEISDGMLFEWLQKISHFVCRFPPTFLPPLPLPYFLPPPFHVSVRVKNSVNR